MFFKFPIIEFVAKQIALAGFPIYLAFYLF
jgi:hypothetical protein